MRRSIACWGLMGALMALPLPGYAQSSPTGADAQPTEDAGLAVWLLTGLDVAVGSRWDVTIRVGHVGGFDSHLALVEVAHTVRPALRLVAGDVYLRPTAPGAPQVNLLRGGLLWRPVRGRVIIESRTLVERAWGATGGGRFRARERLLVSCPTGNLLRMRVFGSAEGFVRGDSQTAHRLLLGASVPMRRVTMEVYWVRHATDHGRRAFKALGLTTSVLVGSQ